MTGNILVRNMTFQYESMLEPIFKDVNVNIHENWRLGLVGRNGRGKTTFFKILRGLVDYEGEVETTLEFTYFPVYPDASSEEMALEVLQKQNPHRELWEIERELSYMNLPAEILYKPFRVLSGGEQTKLLLIELFLNENAFPLIDEPTNNLDLNGRRVVGQYLKNKKGYIVVSHDEAFLNHFVDHILAINKESIDLIKGDVETWKAEKELADERSEEQNAQLKNEIKRLNTVSNRVNTWGNKRESSTHDSTERRLAAKQMKRAKAIKKRTDEKVEEKKRLIRNSEEVEGLKMKVKEPRKRLLYLRHFSILQDGVPLFEDLNVEVFPNERLFIEGKNGVGKSTLLHFLTAQEGFETTGEWEVNLPENLSILDQKNQEAFDYVSYVQSLRAEEKEDFWHLLHQLGMKRARFSNLSTNHQWSAGEVKKIFLSQALLGENALFVWDEVTNSLDLHVIQQLVESILHYGPTMIAVDHNESFVEAVSTKKIELVKVE